MAEGLVSGPKEDVEPESLTKEAGPRAGLGRGGVRVWRPAH